MTFLDRFPRLDPNGPRPKPERRPARNQTINPVTKGIQDAEAQLPIESETETEYNLESEAELDVGRLDAWAVGELRRSQKNVEQLGIEARPSALREIIANLHEVHVTQLINARRALTDLREAARKGDARLKIFQQGRNVSHVPDDPESKAWHFAILYLVVVGESGINSLLFATSHPMGFVGGIATSLIVSGLNICAAILAGHVLRSLHHPGIGVRLGAGTLLALYAAALPILHGAVASYRDLLLTTSPDVALLEALPRILSSPGAISLDSMVLFAIGMLSAGLAARKAYTSQDPTPGYSRVWARSEAAQVAYDDELEATRASLIGVVRSGHEKATTLVARSGDRCERFASVVDEMKRVVIEHQSGRRRIENDSNRALRAYRGGYASSAVAGFVPPERWEVEWLSADSLPAFGFDDSELEKFEKQVEEERSAHGLLVDRVAAFRCGMDERVQHASRELDRFAKGEVDDPDLEVVPQPEGESDETDAIAASELAGPNEVAKPHCGDAEEQR